MPLVNCPDCNDVVVISQLMQDNNEKEYYYCEICRKKHNYFKTYTITQTMFGNNYICLTCSKEYDTLKEIQEHQK